MKEIPRNYLSVQRKLETFKQNRPEPLLDFKHFYQLCVDCEVPNQDIRSVVDYLTNAGDIVYFKDRTCSLAEVRPLNPAVYALRITITMLLILSFYLVCFFFLTKLVLAADHLS